jgi:hypothetical protein
MDEVKRMIGMNALIKNDKLASTRCKNVFQDGAIAHAGGPISILGLPLFFAML